MIGGPLQGLFGAQCRGCVTAELASCACSQASSRQRQRDQGQPRLERRERIERFLGRGDAVRRAARGAQDASLHPHGTTQRAEFAASWDP